MPGGINKYSSQGAANISLGQLGSTLITDTIQYDGTYVAITVISDAVFDVLEDPNRDGSSIAGVTFPAGIVIMGTISSIKLASGIVLAVKG